MMYYAMENEKFREIATAKNHQYQGEEQAYSWRNKHRLIHSEPTAIAGKTGFTKAAGRTLVTYFEKDGKKIIVVTLNDGDDWNTHINLSTKVFSTFKKTTVAKKGTMNSSRCGSRTGSPIELLLKKGEKAKLSNVVHIPRGKNKKSTGLWTVSLDDEVIAAQEIVIKQ